MLLNTFYLHFVIEIESVVYAGLDHAKGEKKKVHMCFIGVKKQQQTINFFSFLLFKSQICA